VTVRIGVVQFPGSNCEHDVVEALDALGADASIVWHGDRRLDALDAVVLPGGFAHGDYLRPGAIARFSPIMAAVTEFAASGGPVVGICNGFQVLTEAHLLPGALQKNRGLTFLCRTVEVEVVSDRSVLTTGVLPGTRLRIPINHFEGNYTCDPATFKELQAQGRIVLRYVDNPNGSVGNIAGVCNDAGNVVGLMPHPERASDPLLGSTDGRVLLGALLSAAGAVPAAASPEDAARGSAPGDARASALAPSVVAPARR
jgi:phosphoribosylformylglycinamidine synthase